MYFSVVPEPQQVVTSIRGMFSHSGEDGKAVDTFDVLVCGGTLGIFIATALSFRGLRVGVVERNILKGVHTVLWIHCNDNFRHKELLLDNQLL